MSNEHKNIDPKNYIHKAMSSIEVRSLSKNNSVENPDKHLNIFDRKENKEDKK